MALSTENFTDLELEIVASLAANSPIRLTDLASITEVTSKEVKSALSSLITGGWIIHRRVEDDYFLSYSGGLLAKSTGLV